MLTPSDLTEIERKARAYQAEESANPDAKTCQRPTPELVLRMVEEVRKQTASRDTQYLERCKVEAERDELRAKVAKLEHATIMVRELEQTIGSFRKTYAGETVMTMVELQKENKELRAKVEEADRERRESQMQAERDAKRADANANEISELRAKVAEKQEAWETCNRAWTLENKRFLEAEARVRELEEAIKGACAEIAKYAAESGRLQAIVDRLPKTADGVPITTGMDVWIWQEFEDESAWWKHTVNSLYTVDGEVFVGSCGWEELLSKCYSTREAALAAHAQKGNANGN